MEVTRGEDCFHAGRHQYLKLFKFVCHFAENRISDFIRSNIYMENHMVSQKMTTRPQGGRDNHMATRGQGRPHGHPHGHQGSGTTTWPPGVRDNHMATRGQGQPHGHQEANPPPLSVKSSKGCPLVTTTCRSHYRLGRVCVCWGGGGPMEALTVEDNHSMGVCFIFFFN